MLIGHEAAFNDLKDLEKRGVLGHGYVFHGPAMVGKKLVAREFAAYLEHTELRDELVLSDTLIIEAGEQTSIGIDEVRTIKNFLWQKPNASTRRALIIDDAELLTTEAQNALLKITEEPPVSSLLILITSDIESILPTITSRLPKIYFGSLPEKDIQNWLMTTQAETNELATKKTAKQKNAKSAADDANILELAQKAMGKPGLAWRLLNDDNLKDQIALAEKLLKIPATIRRDLIKKIIEPDEFNFRKFLDAMILVLAWRTLEDSKNKTKKISSQHPFWHNALRLYERETNFSLNPRLQLEALLAAL